MDTHPKPPRPDKWATVGQALMVGLGADLLFRRLVLSQHPSEFVDLVFLFVLGILVGTVQAYRSGELDRAVYGGYSHRLPGLILGYAVVATISVAVGAWDLPHLLASVIGVGIVWLVLYAQRG